MLKEVLPRSERLLVVVLWLVSPGSTVDAKSRRSRVRVLAAEMAMLMGEVSVVKTGHKPVPFSPEVQPRLAIVLLDV